MVKKLAKGLGMQLKLEFVPTVDKWQNVPRRCIQSEINCTNFNILSNLVSAEINFYTFQAFEVPNATSVYPSGIVGHVFQNKRDAHLLVRLGGSVPLFLDFIVRFTSFFLNRSVRIIF